MSNGKKPPFDPTKPFEVVSQGKKPEFDPTQPFEEVNQEELSGFQKALNVIDIPASLMRTGAEAALSPEKEVLPELGKQFGRIVESPTTAAAMAPTGPQINVQLSRQLGLTRSPEEEAKLRQEFPIAAPVMEAVGGFTTETAMTPGFAFSSLPKINKVTRIPIVNIAEKQAAKALSQYATKSDVISKGKDITLAGARLVAEDLQGLLRNPVKLYEKLSGTTKITKTQPQGLGQQLIKSVPKKKGLISEIANNVDTVISTVEKDYKVKPILPASIVTKKLLEDAKTNLSAISGETVDLQKVEDILTNVLKPFETTIIPEAPITGLVKKPGTLELAEEVIGKTPKGVESTANTLSLSQLQKLRKNIGKQVSDLTFYAASDKNVALEKETLASLYRELGNIIKTELKGRQIAVGKSMVDAGDFYETQNNRMKQLMDVESLLEFTPTEKLKDIDIAGRLMSLAAQAPIFGGMGLAGTMLDMPVATGGAVVGAGLSAARTAGKMAEEAAPEYLTSIFKQASKIPSIPYGAAMAPLRGTIQYMREGQPVSDIGRSPQSVGLTPEELISYRIPRNTKAILENKEKVLAKLAQQGIPPEMLKAVAQGMNGDPDDLSNAASIMSSQFPDIFEKFKIGKIEYSVFDGKFLDPNDKARAADQISKRDDLNSIERARMINKINRTGEVPEGM